MNEPGALGLLRSQLPSERARAAEWFLANASGDHVAMLTEAIESEPVPSLKRLLGLACRKARQPDVPRSEVNTTQFSEVSVPAEILESLSGLLRHETEPVIGWLRRSAARDIGDNFETSDTFRNIDLLRRRLRGLEALTAAHRLPNWTAVSLSQLVAECRPPDLPQDALARAPRADDDVIDSDVGLMSIIVGNALLNAHEASASQGDGAIWVESAVTDRDFWISITNRFEGEGFELDHVVHTGTSTKVSHKGLGLSAMRLAAERLGYQLSLTASGGTAFFSLRGERFRA